MKLVATTSQDQEVKLLDAVNKILDDNKTDSQNRVVAKQLFRSTQVAEFWYPIKTADTHEDYGFSTPFKLRMSVFSPWTGVALFPFFDDFGDLIAFSRLYKTKDEDNKEVQNF